MAILHLRTRTPRWKRALHALCVGVPVGIAAWSAFGPEALPLDAATQSAAAPPPVPQAPGVGALPMALRLPPSHLATATPSPPVGHAPVPDVPPAATDIAPDDFAARNAAVDARRLTATRPLAAQSFLAEVLLAPDTRAGFVVAEVLPGSRYDRMGLQPGDLVYTLDAPQSAAVDESSMIALMTQTSVELDVYRQGRLVHLSARLDEDTETPDADRPR